jgi:glycosyltransferase involved in cell wall biosynthesis
VLTIRHNGSKASDPALLEGLPPDLIVYRTGAPELLEMAIGVRAFFRRILRSASRPIQPSAPPASPPAARSEVVSRRTIADWVSWWLQIPDRAIGWLPAGCVVALHAAQRHHARALYSSAPYWTNHLIGLVAKRFTGLPWMADFRDPWRANPFRKIPYQAIDQIDAWLEREVITHADWVICNSPYVREDFIKRFPDQPDRFVTIPNGYDPEDFVDIEPRRPVADNQLVLTHAGVFYGPRRPEPIFQAMRLLQSERRLRRKPCLQLLGSPMYSERPIETIAAELGVKEQVLVAGEVSHRRVLEALRGSDMQVLVGFAGQGSELQVPAKLFEYMGVGRPILALAPKRGAIAEVLEQAAVPCEICDPEDPREIAQAIISLESRTNGPLPSRNQPGSRANCQFQRREQVSRIAQLLDESCRREPAE